MQRDVKTLDWTSLHLIQSQGHSLIFNLLLYHATASPHLELIKLQCVPHVVITVLVPWE